MLDLLTDKRQINAPDIVNVPPAKYLDPKPHHMEVLEEKKEVQELQRQSTNLRLKEREIERKKIF